MFAKGLAALVVALCLAPSAALAADPPATPGQFVDRTFTNAAGTRAYKLFVPSTGAAGKPLMIWLHGCGGPIGPMEPGHALAKVAEERGFSVAFPAQPISANPGMCWNWFQPAHIHRGQGEPSIIAGITTALRGELGADASRVYVGGYSAGGAMTTVMGAAYPDLYAAIAPGAGAPYSAEPTGAAANTEMGPRARPVPAYILQGLTDQLVVYPLGRVNVLQWLGTDDYADDGASNSSVAKTPSSTEPQVIATDVPIPAVIEHYVSGGCELVQLVTSPYEHLINGALFSFDQGLELQRSMMNFLLAHRLGGLRVGCG
jgi:poly(hydroxyalkanoate) depolymerase family esterase